MTREEFLAWEQISRDTLEVKRVYIDVAGDLVTGLMLSQIIYWHLPSSTGESKLRVERNGRLWLAKQRKDWWAECRITEKQVDRCIRKLVDRGIIVTRLFKFSGNPTIHISMNWNVFLSLLSQTLENFDFDKGGKSFSPKRKKSNSAVGQNVISKKAKTITENTAQNSPKTTTTRSLVVPDENREYNAHTVKVPLTSHTIKRLINLLVPSEPSKLYHAAHVLNWQISRGYVVCNYEGLIAAMLRRSFVHPEGCPSPTQEREEKQKAAEEKLATEKLHSRKEEYWQAAEKEFDSLDPEIQTSLIDEVKKKYPIAKSCKGLKTLAVKLHMDGRKHDGKSD